MEVVTNNNNYIISHKQAQYFAIQVFTGMKKYIEEHRAEYEKWLTEHEKTKDINNTNK
ncbi:hypothetical protein [Ruminococcus flavefaciens]|uniref:hypothetical protein n=1 Tax=Ruminococcus flavefaciens TaxID=1265 RepID=UPI0004ADA0B4|nr:hypothetical protein [Ruminococcus flavefaciens]